MCQKYNSLCILEKRLHLSNLFHTIIALRGLTTVLVVPSGSIVFSRSATRGGSHLEALVPLTKVCPLEWSAVRLAEFLVKHSGQQVAQLSLIISGDFCFCFLRSPSILLAPHHGGNL